MKRSLSQEEKRGKDALASGGDSKFCRARNKAMARGCRARNKAMARGCRARNKAMARGCRARNKAMLAIALLSAKRDSVGEWQNRHNRPIFMAKYTNKTRR